MLVFQQKYFVLPCDILQLCQFCWSSQLLNQMSQKLENKIFGNFDPTVKKISQIHCLQITKNLIQ